MQNLDFYYLRADNFICFGEKFELDFRKYGNIVSIRGENLDVPGSKNGCGKSALPDIVVYTLYGKTIKGLSQEEAIHNKIGKKLRTEVRWGDYRVVRCRKPNSLRVWYSPNREWEQPNWTDHPKTPHASEITKGGIPATEEYIEDKLIGLTYESFINIFVFSDNNAGSFLECDTPTKREIVENLLSLGPYRAYSEQAKKLKNSCEATISSIAEKYQQLLDYCELCKKRVEKITQQEVEWRSTKKKELEDIIKQIENKKNQLNSTDTGAALQKYNESQESIKEKTELVEKENKNLELIKSILSDGAEKLNSCLKQKKTISETIQSNEFEIKTLKKAVSSSEQTIASFEAKKGQICPNCLGKVKSENFQHLIDAENTNIKNNTSAALLLENSLIEPSKSLKILENNIITLQNGIAKFEQKYKLGSQNISTTQKEILELNKIKRPEVNVDEKIIESQIEDLKKYASFKKKEGEGVSPYVEIMKSSVAETEEKNKECVEKRAELVEAEKQLPYYEFWTKGFGDAGIRKFVVDSIIPVLNSKIAYWMQFLIDGKIKLTFDNELKETIERNPPDGDPFVYSGMSGGEKRRLNLAVSQAFAHVMTVNSGAALNIAFLDEVTSNVCPVGVEGIFNMIQELAKNKQVFVTTHDKDLLQMLNGNDVINLVKHKGFARLL